VAAKVEAVEELLGMEVGVEAQPAMVVEVLLGVVVEEALVVLLEEAGAVVVAPFAEPPAKLAAVSAAQQSAQLVLRLLAVAVYLWTPDCHCLRQAATEEDYSMELAGTGPTALSSLHS